MSEIATYTFLPWLRQGIANNINPVDDSNIDENIVSNRATITVNVQVLGEKVEGNDRETATIKKKIQIYGPGDIVGIDKQAIVKVEPRNWITNFETNYMPYIEFYDEDFPWRYTPFNPKDNNVDKHRLKPWVVLIVLEEGEFDDGQNIKDRPLPFIKVKETSHLPDLKQSWAWAHVQVNESLIPVTEKETVTISKEIVNNPDSGTPTITVVSNTEDVDKLKSETPDEIAVALQGILDRNPDLAYSRIICPRKLEPKKAYHAFLVPAFETGRLAGLGQNPEDANLIDEAWEANVENHELPYYHRWYFRTGTIGDFEYLVRLLEPKPVDSRVGTRDMDAQRIGANLKGLEDPDTAVVEEEKLNGILKLGGALRIPASSQKDKEEAEKYEYWAFRNDKTPAEISIIADKNNAIEQPLNINDFQSFQQNIAQFINLTDQYQDKTPVVDETQRIKDIHENADIEQEIPATNQTEYDINNNPDPLITAPLYGRWHALTQRLVKKRDNTPVDVPNYNWIHELNLDPRWRVSAGFGTKVVQENQETYMKAAWEQVGDVLGANKKIREAQLAKIVAEIWHQKHLLPLKIKSEAQWLNVASPVHKRVLAPYTLENSNQQQLSVFYQKKESKLTTAVTSPMMRKVLRPRGKFVRKRLPFTDSITPDNLITRINNGEVSAAPPRVTPTGIQTPQDLVDATKPNNAPNFLLVWLKRFPWLRWIPLIIAILLLLFLLLFTPAVAVTATLSVVIVGLVYLFLLMTQWIRQTEAAKTILEDNQTPEAIDDLPQSPDFRITRPNQAFTPSFSGNTDSQEAQNFKAALKDVNTILVESKKLGEVKVRPPLDIVKVNEAVFEKVNPSIAIPKWIDNALFLPSFIRFQQKEQFEEAQAYPTFDLPMYKPLADYSAELFLPNINFIDQNSISLLETNQKFIESYMVGLNHEFARELLWREYPTDQRGSYFRQFWETNGYIDDSPITRTNLLSRYKKVFETKKLYIPELVEYKEKLEDTSFVPKNEVAFLEEAHRLILREELRDIKPIHYWSKQSRLGTHDYRELQGEEEDEAVLVIRGELLKKYPTAVIYAHRAEWQTKDDGTIDNTQERVLKVLPNGQVENREIIKSSLYEAKVDPDIYFFGFDLTIPEAKGGDGTNPEDDPGWFFVIKERPGEPRFGLDIGDGGNIDENNKIELWNDLSWGDITPAVNKGGFLQITNATPTFTANQILEADDGEKETQQKEDMQITWSENMNSAELAYILYQVPVLVAIHASEMLPD